MSKTKTKSDNKTEKALAAEKEQFAKQQLHSISKTLVSGEASPKEKHVRSILVPESPRFILGNRERRQEPSWHLLA
ncbi:hypothetical protein EYF80_066855 [Liparis tanakae]|uniref:Uncharacterized protein n=1 Tax=Liparis tanakae TaxID=230148 RepID=A0A4Z2E2Q1_9TELE|nr:hypothetical protein EYF80_066855 [Liparis tanakae]